MFGGHQGGFGGLGGFGGTQGSFLGGAPGSETIINNYYDTPEGSARDDANYDDSDTREAADRDVDDSGQSDDVDNSGDDSADNSVDDSGGDDSGDYDSGGDDRAAAGTGSRSSRRQFLGAGFATLAAGTASAEEPRRIIDTHIHLYDPTRPQGVPWPAKDNTLLYRRTLPADFRAATNGLGVTGRDRDRGECMARRQPVGARFSERAIR